MKISVYGTGYVGIVQGAVLADSGNQVICVDNDEIKIKKILQGEMPIHEPNLSDIVNSNINSGRLTFTTDIKNAIKISDIHFIAVGTPLNQDGNADVSQVITISEMIGNYIEKYSIIINKSTVPVGMSEEVENIINKALLMRGLRIDFDVVSNPEFLKEGSAVTDCQRPDRIIIGANSNRAKNTLRDLYRPFNRVQDKIIYMSARSAEMTKYAANCMLATRISLMNELAAIAEELGADIESVRLGVGSDKRIGSHFIYAGVGYGGSCFPKDIRALSQAAQSVGIDPAILTAVENRNESQKKLIYSKINKHFNKKLYNKIIAIWGLAFKPNTDDIREAPSRVLMESLLDAGVKVHAFDPAASKNIKDLYRERNNLLICDDMYVALDNADALVIMTEWKQFQSPDFDRLKKKMKSPLVFDGRNIFDPSQMRQLGFTYYSIGRA